MVKYSTLNKIKKITLAALFIISIIPFTHSENKSPKFFSETQERNLQYTQFSSSGIYYTLKYPKNDITGTGDLLQDVSFKVMCVIKKCPGGCCTGELNNVQCATAEDCKIYFDSTRVGNVAAAIIIPISVTALFIIFLILFLKKYELACDISFLLAFTCMFVITIPFVFCYIKKNFKSISKKNEKDSKQENFNLIGGHKELEIKHEADKIILCDNKKIDTEKHSNVYNNKEYKKLSSEEDINKKNTNVVSLSNNHENSDKRTHIPDIIFDENLKDEKNSNYSKSKKDDDDSQNRKNKFGFDNTDDNKESLNKSHHSENYIMESERNQNEINNFSHNSSKKRESMNNSRDNKENERIDSAKKSERIDSAKKSERIDSAKKSERIDSAKKSERIDSAKKSERIDSAKKSETNLNENYNQDNNEDKVENNEDILENNLEKPEVNELKIEESEKIHDNGQE